MASIAISSATPSIATQPVPIVKTAPVNLATTEKAPATLKPDTVRLSAAAQAKMMHRSGQSATLIAASLGTNVATVDGYLNIKVAAQAAAAPTSAPAKEAEPAEQATPAAQTAPTEQAKPSAPAAQTVPAEEAATKNG